MLHCEGDMFYLQKVLQKASLVAVVYQIMEDCSWSTHLS